VDIVASVVLMSHAAEEVRLSQDRRDKILDFLLEWLTGDQIDSKTLGHFRFIGTMFGLTAKVKEMVGRTSSVQGRQELAVSLALAALNIAVSDEPVQATERQLERREAREAEKAFKQSLTGRGKAAPALPIGNKPAATKRQRSQDPSAVYKRQRRANMTEDELAALRAYGTQRQRERRARLKAAKSLQELSDSLPV
jgi:hypothetical protein